MSKSDEEEAGEDQVEEKKFFAELAKTGRASCKKCKQKIDSGSLRLAKSGYNPFGPGLMKMWHHVDCLFEVFKKQRAATARINTPDDIEGWSDLEEDDRAQILQHLPDINADDYKSAKKEKPAETPKKTKGKKTKAESKSYDDDEKEKKSKKAASAPAMSSTLSSLLSKSVPGHKDNTFREFRRLCVQVANESSYTGKTALIKKLFEKGTNGDEFKGDLRLWIKLLLPRDIKRVYNLQSKQLLKLFSRILRQNLDDMLEDLEQGDVAETISKFFQESKHCRPPKNSHLTMQDVDKFLEELSQLTKEDDQAHLFTQISGRCTANDLTYIIRLVKHDLRINAGPKHVLEAIHPEAYLAFQTSRDLDTVLEEVFSTKKEEKGNPKALNIGVKLMTPVLPMLAEACKSVEHALKKCPNGMFSEIKYDGERVQVHKSGDEFKYFSRSLKPVMPHKVKEFKDYIPKAFPGGEDIILDSEILMIDTKTGQPLPFGTLGIHKKGEYQDACVCLFVFDCIYYNGKSLLQMPIKKRRQYLLENMTEIKNHVVFSEVQEVHNAKDLENMMTKVFQMGLEGLVLKDLESPYEPGKRHWLKVKKDYLFGGAMADTADLVVLGAWFGTGQKGGMMSVFLMGCWDPSHKCWCTVTKVHTGHDDKTLERLQDELKMEKISKDVGRVPSWLKCTKTMVPDFVAKNPKEMPVWEITGAEFTQHDVHTAAGISIRFPRVTRIRSDKDWETATSLPELKELYKKSKDSSDFCLPTHLTTDDVGSESESPKKKDNQKMRTKEDSDDESQPDDQKEISLKRQRGRENSVKQKPNRNHSPKPPASRKNSPKRKPKTDPQKENAVTKGGEASREQKNKYPAKSDIDSTSEDDDTSEPSCQKQSKHSKEHESVQKMYESPPSEEIEEEPESINDKPTKKRKESDSSETSESVKKVKLEEPSEISHLDEQLVDNALTLKQEVNSNSARQELFVNFLISEMEMISNPVLYDRVKGQLFEIVHKAQEEQRVLDANKCSCLCIHCHSVRKNVLFPSDPSNASATQNSPREEKEQLNLVTDEKCVKISEELHDHHESEPNSIPSPSSQVGEGNNLISNDDKLINISEKSRCSEGENGDEHSADAMQNKIDQNSVSSPVESDNEHCTVASPVKNGSDHSAVGSPKKNDYECSSPDSPMKNDEHDSTSSDKCLSSATVLGSAKDNETSDTIETAETESSLKMV